MYGSSGSVERFLLTEPAAGGTETLLLDIGYSYDDAKALTGITEKIRTWAGYRENSCAYTYDKDGQTKTSAYGKVSLADTWDQYGRRTQTKVRNTSAASPSDILTTSYAYRLVSGSYTTGQVETLTNTFGKSRLTHQYSYDVNGSIISDSIADSTAGGKTTGSSTRSKSGSTTSSGSKSGSTTSGGNTSAGASSAKTVLYAYDSLGELVSEKNGALGKAWTYTYDLGGNILTKTEYSYDPSTGAMTGPKTVNYTYGDASWGDLLTSYDGSSITYDAIGNPLSYRGWTMDWTWGKQLSSMTGSGKTLRFTCGDGGLRTSKNVTSGGSTKETRFLWDGSRLVAQLGADSFFFRYDGSGTMTGYTYVSPSGAETECLFVRNLQGDVEKIIGLDGSVLASYTYDAWGRVLSSSGSLADINPIRYRGYYYDTETSLYYLQSRYYDPETGRFLNADSYESTGQGVLGCNKFAYCLNNPINRTDDGGDLSNTAKVLIGVGIIAVAAAVTVATGGAAAGTLAAAVNCVASGALSGAVAGAVNGAVSGAVNGAVTSVLKNGSLEGAGQAAIDGAATGFMTGAAAGAVIGGATSAATSACFVEGTPVLAENGLIPIEEVTAGMMVWSADPETGDVALRHVVQTFVRETGELTHVTIADEAGNTETITCTPEHPFYVEGRGWIGAGALHRGMKVRFASGASGIVKDVLCEELQKPVAVYNFEVDDFHTYYVGTTSVLVHNVCYKKLEADEIGRRYNLKDRSFHRKIKAKILKELDSKTKSILGDNPDILLDRKGNIALQSTVGKTVMIELGKNIEDIIIDLYIKK